MFRNRANDYLAATTAIHWALSNMNNKMPCEILGQLTARFDAKKENKVHTRKILNWALLEGRTGKKKKK